MHRHYRAPVRERLAALDELSESAPKSITILGAGMAGLVAAYELSKRGHDVSVLEATSRPGGRVHTWRVTADTPDGPCEYHHEFGAMRIPKNHHFTRHYIDKFGLDLRRFVTAHEDADAWFYLRGRRFQMKDAAAHIPGLYDLPFAVRDAIAKINPETPAVTVPKILMGEVVGPILEALTPDDERALTLDGPPTALSAKLESTALGELLAEDLRDPDAVELAGAATGLEVWWHIACTLLFREEILGDAAPYDEISKGTDTLPSKLYEQLSGKCKIDYNTAVTAIEVLPDGRVRLSTQPTEGEFGPDRYPQIPEGAGSSSTVHDFVLCTLPFSVLRGMALTGLSPQKMAAIRMMNYESSTKVLLLCDERRWERDAIVGGATMSDTILRATYYPSDHQERPASGPVNGTLYRIESPVPKDEMPSAPNPAEPGVLVASYSWGRDARRMAAIPHEQRVEVCVNVLEKIHPGIGADVRRSASACWDNHPWARGAFALPHPNETPVHLENGRRPEGHLFFAGEHLSFNPGWIQGAIISSLDAVEDLLSYRI